MAKRMYTARLTSFGSEAFQGTGAFRLIRLGQTGLFVVWISSASRQDVGERWLAYVGP
jgi:hypothetical protein